MLTTWIILLFTTVVVLSVAVDLVRWARQWPGARDRGDAWHRDRCT